MEFEASESAAVVDSSANSSDLRSGRKRSDVWPHVRQLGGGKYECIHCPSGSQVWSSLGTSNVRNHLLSKHDDVYKSTKQKDLLDYGFLRVVKKRASGSTDAKEPMDAKDGYDKAIADNKLIEWIVSTAQPFAVVDQVAFMAFCASLRPDYTVMCRQTARKRVLSRWRREKEQAREQLRCEVASRRVGFTTDMWTSAANKGYMVVTMHWLDSFWRNRSIIIGFTRVEYPHSGVRLAEHFIETVKAMDGALLGSIWCVTTDNASNNETMVEVLNQRLPGEMATYALTAAPSSASEMELEDEEPRASSPKVLQLRCMAHVLQLAVKEGLKQCPLVDTEIGTIRDILKKTADSPKLMEALGHVCDVLQIKFTAPALDCATRWNSTMTMVMSAIKLMKPIEELLRRIRDRHEGYTDFTISPDHRLASAIPPSTWLALKAFCSFLMPIKAATTMMSGKNYPTFGMTLVVYHLASKHAAKAASSPTPGHTRAFARAFKSKLDEYASAVKTREAKIAAALDPRAKAMLSQMVGDVDALKLVIIDEYEAEYKSIFEGQHGNESPARSQEDEEEESEGDILHQLMDEHFSVNAPTSPQSEQFSGELDRWMVQIGMDMKSSSRDVCKWIEVNGALFPRIQMMARDFLGVTATSVPSEEAFSAAGATVSVRRARLGDDTVSAISELQSFLQFNDASFRNR